MVLPPGAPGKSGGVSLEFAPLAGRTRLVAARQRVPLHVGRVLHPQADWRELAQVTVTMPTGGMVQGDEVALRIVAHAGARAHVTSQSATRAYRCPNLPIVQRIVLEADADALLEWWPDPLIPYAGTDLAQQIEMTVGPRATMLIADCWLAGRIARGEAHAYASLRFDTRARRPDGTLLFRDTIRLSSKQNDLLSVGQLADAAAVGTFFLVGPDVTAMLERPLTSALQDVLPGRGGVTRLPNEAGLLVRLLATRSEDLRRGQRLVLGLAHRQLFQRAASDHVKG